MCTVVFLSLWHFCWDNEYTLVNLFIIPYALLFRTVDESRQSKETKAEDPRKSGKSKYRFREHFYFFIFFHWRHIYLLRCLFSDVWLLQFLFISTVFSFSSFNYFRFVSISIFLQNFNSIIYHYFLFSIF